MKTVVKGCVFVLDNVKSENVRKNDVKNLNIIVDKNNSLIEVELGDKQDIKKIIRKQIASVLGVDKFHLEQVYTLGDDKSYFDNKLDILYLTVINKDKIKLKKDFYLKKFDIIDNEQIIFEEDKYPYETKKITDFGGVEYIHEIKANEQILKKTLLEMLICFKHLRSRLDNTDVIYKLLPDKFPLEDVRQVYEKISGKQVDKSNFRKKISKYCSPIDEIVRNQGYRPTKLFEYKANLNDEWI